MLYDFGKELYDSHITVAFGLLSLDYR